MEGVGSGGAKLYIPLGHSPDCDLIADRDGDLLRVQVKTSTVFRKRRWEVTLCTRGGNQSWNGLVKRLDSTRCDYLFVLVADGRRWFIPGRPWAEARESASAGPKYASFEVDPGAPLPAGACREAAPLQSERP